MKRQFNFFNFIWNIIGWIGVWQGVFDQNPYYLAGGAVMIVSVWLEMICQAIYEARRRGPR